IIGGPRTVPRRRRAHGSGYRGGAGEDRGDRGSSARAVRAGGPRGAGTGGRKHLAPGAAGQSGAALLQHRWSDRPGCGSQAADADGPLTTRQAGGAGGTTRQRRGATGAPGSGAHARQHQRNGAGTLSTIVAAVEPHAPPPARPPLEGERLRQVADAIAGIVGERWVRRAPSALVAYSSDGLPGYHRRPALLVLPGTREELTDVVRFLARERLPFVPRGAGTGLSGGALAEGS